LAKQKEEILKQASILTDQHQNRHIDKNWNEVKRLFHRSSTTYEQKQEFLDRRI
jgi:hypothetical protein